MRKVKQLQPADMMLLTMGLVNTQVKVYKGKSTYSGDVIATIRDNKV